MIKLTDKEIGYIAGIIDGEGSICLHKCIWKNRGGVFYRPFIKIPNTNLDMLLWIKNKLGFGSVKIEREQTDKWKKLYTLTFSANMIREFLPIILDSLLIKKSQSLLLLEFLRMSKRGLPRYFKQNNEDKYLKFYMTMKNFNQRGVIEKTANSGELLKNMGQSRTKQRDLFSGVRNDYIPSSKEII